MIRPSIAVRLVEVWRDFDSPAETVHAVAGVSLEARPGELLAITGESGSGKSTLLNLVGGLDRATRGEIEVLGQRVDLMNEKERSALRLRQVGVVFQSHNLIEELSVADNVALPLELAGYPSEAVREQTSRALALVGLGDLSTRYPAEISGGQRQRVGIARAVAGDRRVVLADEPTGSLDRANSASVADSLLDLARAGVTVLVATHDPVLVGRSTRVVELRDGGLR